MKLKRIAGAMAVAAMALTLGMALGMATAIASGPTLDTPRWTGLWLSVNGGAANTNIDVGFAGAIGIDGIGQNGMAGGGSVGYNYQFPNSPVVVGVFGGATYYDADFKLSLGGGSLKIGPTHDWNVGGRLGLAFGRMHAYGLAAYSQMKGEASITGLGSVDDTFKGLQLGGGIEYLFAGGMFAGLEYRKGLYKEKSYASGLLTIEPEIDTTMVRAGYRF